MGAPCVDLLATLSLWGRQVPWEDAFWGCRLLFQPPLAGEDPSSTVGLCFVLYSLDKLYVSSLRTRIPVQASLPPIHSIRCEAPTIILSHHHLVISEYSIFCQ